MYRAALIFGLLALFVAAGSTTVSPVCTPCEAVFLGLGAGYLAGAFEKPRGSNATARAGAIGGAISGIGAVLGQMGGTAINAYVVGPEAAQQIVQQWGLPAAGSSVTQAYWFGLVGGALCCSLLDVLLMAAFGALGGFLWWQIRGKNAGLSSPLMPA